MIALKNAAKRRIKQRSASFPAPTGGWNARESFADMAVKDAVALQNFFPGTNNVLLRHGYTRFATGMTGQIESLMAYTSASTSKLFAAAGTNIYDATPGGTINSAAVSSLTNGRWQHCNITIAGGTSYLVCVNGADKMRSYNGSAWHLDGDGAGYDITNVNSNTFVGVTAFKNRLWFVQNASLKAWYLPVQAISGAAVALDMQTYCSKGGYLMAVMNWTLDAGFGMDDYLVFITSEGEVLVWRLTDPTTPTGIALIGVYQIGAPIGRRCWVKYAGDLLLITQDGVVPMSGALQSSRLNPRVSITDKIQYAVSSAITSYGSNFGWQLMPFPKQNQLYVNVPVAEGSLQQQYVQNNITKNWCNFTGWAANCWELFNDHIYFGSDTYIGKAWDGYSDNDTNINGLALQSFQDFGVIAEKHAKLIRYHLRSDGSPTIYGNVNVDYDTQDVSAQLSAVASDYDTWDGGDWDSAIWGSGLVPSAVWQSATGMGYTMAPFLKVSSKGIQLLWAATDLIYEVGGSL